jgi:hypothetical protein
MNKISRAYARKKGRDNVTVDDLIHVITPKGRGKFFAIFFDMTFLLLYEIYHFLRCMLELEGKYNQSIKVCIILQYCNSGSAELSLIGFGMK